MTKLDQNSLNQIVAAVMQVLGGQGAAPTGAAPKANGGNTLEHKDRQLVNTFTRRGFKNVVLMDRGDKSKPFNIKPYKAWIAEGRVVRRGERGVRGLFHVDQTDVIAPASPSKVRKPSLKPVPVKSQLPLV